MNINKGKSNVLLFNHDGIRLEVVRAIRVSNIIRYLGADMGDSRICFREHRKGKIQLAERMANLTFSVISKSCNKLLIGKTYWKNVMQPSVSTNARATLDKQSCVITSTLFEMNTTCMRWCDLNFSCLSNSITSAEVSRATLDKQSCVITPTFVYHD